MSKHATPSSVPAPVPVPVPFIDTLRDLLGCSPGLADATLRELGWRSSLHTAWQRLQLAPPLVPARVVTCHREDQLVLALPDGTTRRAAPSGRLLYTASGPDALPAVGDWVAALVHDTEAATVTAVLPRRGALTRARPGGGGARQVIAANVDVVFIVTSLNRDLNPRRLERYLALARDGNATPVIVLSKADQGDEATLDAARDRLAALAERFAVVVTSAHTGLGLDTLERHLGHGRTAALVGSSGVGKSTLTNCLLGTALMATREIRSDDDRGRHCTTHRELVVLDRARGLLVDTPGMRELALGGAGDGEALDAVFDDVVALTTQCRFRDCEHEGEPGCAVEAAVEAGELTPERLRAWRKLQRELAHERRGELSRAEKIALHKRRMARARQNREVTRRSPKK